MNAQNAFHTPSLNQRRIIHASYMSGVPEKVHKNRQPTAPIWQVLDPSGTINEGARFGRMDLDYGARNQVWQSGTYFVKTDTGRMYYFDPRQIKVRTLVIRCSQCKQRQSVRYVNKKQVCFRCGFEHGGING